jgi:hypothetical protein
MLKTKAVLAALAILAGTAVRADTVDVSSTTMLTVGQQTRDGAPGRDPELFTIAPVFEIVNISAHDVRNPVADDLSLVVSTWASYDINTPVRWDNGTSSQLTGDVVTGYVSGRFLKNALTLRVGREMVMTGVARMIQVDGGEALVTLPFGLRLSGYAGVPVSQRFTTRSGTVSWNPVAGDLAYGGRAAYYLDLPGGVSGRGVDLGASVNFVEDGGDPVRQEAGVDFRLMAIRNLTLSGFGAYSLYDERFSEAQLDLQWRVTKPLVVNADWRFVEPGLLLSRNSILSVFSASSRQYVGGGATYELGHGFDVGANYHLVLEPGDEPDTTFHGHEADARVDWKRGQTRLGAEAFYLDALENGYVGGRVFGRQDYGRFFAAVDVLAHRFREEINGERSAVTGTLTAGCQLAKGFSAVVSGRAGVTPYMEQTYDLMVKLAYNASYRIREVR